MRRTDLKTPILRRREIAYSEFRYPIVERTFLPQPIELPKTSFSEILSLRRSRREFDSLPPQKLNALLWYSARALEVNPPAHSTRWQHRPAASAGGRHPIDILILTRNDGKTAVHLYQPEPHALATLSIAREPWLENLFSSISEIINAKNSTILWLAAQFDRTLSRYKHGESLVWRDAGVLIATISLVAECLRLNCCAIGITGEPFISQLLSSNRDVVGVGGMLVGQRLKNNQRGA